MWPDGTHDGHYLLSVASFCLRPRPFSILLSALSALKIASFVLNVVEDILSIDRFCTHAGDMTHPVSTRAHAILRVWRTRSGESSPDKKYF